MKNQKGFTHVEIAFGVVILLIIIFAGWSTYKHQSSASDELRRAGDLNASVNQSDDSDNPAVPLGKTYTNEKYGFGFEYPKDWTVKERDTTQDDHWGGEFIETRVTSPSGTKIVLTGNITSDENEPNDCIDVESEDDQHTSRSCYTMEILSADKLEGGTDDYPVYLYKTKITPPTMLEGEKTVYRFQVIGGDEIYKPKANVFTPKIFDEGTLVTQRSKNSLTTVRIVVDSENTDTMYSSNYFNSDEAQGVEAILRTISLL